MDPEEELLVEGGAEVEGDGDADDRDEEGNVDDDGDVSHRSRTLFYFYEETYRQPLT